MVSPGSVDVQQGPSLAIGDEPQFLGHPMTPSVFRQDIDFEAV